MTRAELVQLLEKQRKAAERGRANEARGRAIPALLDVEGRPVVYLQDPAPKPDPFVLLDPLEVLEALEPEPEPAPKPVLVTTIDVPLPPSWNRVFKARAIKLPGTSKWTGQVYKSKDAKDYAEQIERYCAENDIRPFIRTVMLRVSGVIAMERAGCDLDDRLKVGLDALQGFVFEDDEQVAEFGELRRIVDPARPGMRLTFTPVAVDRYGNPK